MEFLKSVHKFIPGFRQLSPNSMIIAGTYYGAAVFILVKYWYWGLALLALPFFVFALLDLNRRKRRGLALAVSAVAGLLVLAGAFGGFAAGERGQAAQVSPAVSALKSAASSASASPSPLAQASPRATASPEAAAGQYAYVAAKGGKVFHRPDCALAKRIKPGNLVGYASKDEAEAAGLQPCKVCKP